MEIAVFALTLIGQEGNLVDIMCIGIVIEKLTLAGEEEPHLGHREKVEKALQIFLIKFVNASNRKQLGQSGR